MDSHSKRRQYKSNAKARKFTLGPGEKGFLCSCNNREKECIKECYVILNKYADELYPSQECQKDIIATSSDNKTVEDIDDELQKEIESLKEQNKNINHRRFQVLDSGAKNLLFVRTNLDDPVLLACTIAEDILKLQHLQTRFLIRLIPIEVTCKAYIDDIKRACKPLLEKHFQNDAKTFSVIYNHRNNNNLSKDDVIKEIADLVYHIRPDHVVNLHNPQISIIVEVIKGITLLAVIPKYLQYKKFNLHGLCDRVHVETNKDSTADAHVSDKDAVNV